MQLQDYLKSKRVPLMIYLELTHRCSFLCVHCYIPENLRQPKDLSVRSQPLGLSTDELKQLMVDLAACGTVFFSFYRCGEIFLRDDLEELTSHATKLGFAVKYYTNGFHITPKWADTMKRLGVYGVDMSVYGASEETYQAITQVKGGYKRVINSIKLLHERNIRFTLKTPVLKENYQDIPQIKALAENYGGYFRYDLVIIPRFDGDQAPTQHSLSNSEIDLLLQKLDAKIKIKAPDVAVPSMCFVGRWSAVVSPAGEVYPCIELRQSIGNVRKQPFHDIWQENPHMRRIRQVLDNIKPDVEAFGDGLCNHCPAYSLHATGDMTKPSPEHRRIAAVKRKYVQS